MKTNAKYLSTKELLWRILELSCDQSTEAREISTELRDEYRSRIDK